MNETKHRIICAWSALLAELPMEKIHLDDILGIAEVSRDTFYYYFDGVSGMPVDILEEEADEILDKLDLAEDGEGALYELLSFLRNRRMMLMRLYASEYQPYVTEFADAVSMKLARILLSGKGERTAYKGFACGMLADGISGCIRRYMANEGETVLMSDGFTEMLLHYAEHIG